jgi:hypothetical protein
VAGHIAVGIGEEAVGGMVARVGFQRQGGFQQRQAAEAQLVVYLTRVASTPLRRTEN